MEINLGDGNSCGSRTRLGVYGLLRAAHSVARTVYNTYQPTMFPFPHPAGWQELSALVGMPWAS